MLTAEKAARVEGILFAIIAGIEKSANAIIGTDKSKYSLQPRNTATGVVRIIPSNAVALIAANESAAMSPWINISFLRLGCIKKSTASVKRKIAAVVLYEKAMPISNATSGANHLRSKHMNEKSRRHNVNAFFQSMYQ